jgi:hypothetical protein
MGIADEKTAILLNSIEMFRVLLRILDEPSCSRRIYVNGSRQKQSSELSINLLQIHSLHSLSSMSISNLYIHFAIFPPLFQLSSCLYNVLLRLELESAEIEMIECEIVISDFSYRFFVVVTKFIHYNILSFSALLVGIFVLN